MKKPRSNPPSPRQAADLVLASAEKIGAISPYQVLDLQSVTGIITDANETSVAELRAVGANILA